MKINSIPAKIDAAMSITMNIKFIKYIFFVIIYSVLILGFTSKQENQDDVIFPEPFTFSIHDLGWMIGNNDADLEGVSGPYRAGVDREFDVQDYEAIITVAKAAGTRIRGLFVTCELDRLNVLKKYPTTTWEGDLWKNKQISEKQLEIIEYVKNNASHLEFGLHGVCHGYWANDGRMYAEWYNSKDKQPWPKENVQNHILGMKEIMAQYGLSEENGHSFPESFDAGNNSYYWNPTPGDDEYSLGYLLSKEGCRYISNTSASFPPENNPPVGPNSGGLDNGVLVICKGGGEVVWYEYATTPITPLKEQGCNMMRLHFPNFLAQDQFLQKSVNREFIDYYRMVQASSTRYVAKNTEQFYSQWLYQKYAVVQNDGNGEIVVDNRNMPDEVYEYELLGNLVLKIKLEDGEHLMDARINNESIACYYEDQGFGFLYLPVLKKEKYRISFEKGTNVKMPHVYNDGTYNLYYFYHEQGKGTEIKVRVYGEQKLKLRNITNYFPDKITSSNENLKIKNVSYSEIKNELELTLKAHNLQGETGIILLGY